MRAYFNSELPPDTYRCSKERRLIEVDLAYIKKRPKAITNELLERSLQGEKQSLKILRKALRTYRDSEIDKGFDGVVVLRNEGNHYELTTIGAVDNDYERSSKVTNQQKMDIKTINYLFCSSLSELPYAYMD
ncbi:hypothetical protein AYR66_02555 [Noviherbaspirillum denitrificans]|uniref:Uncharacterized protein n=1 Tax=Noviherbaspirillum denitrificans TaxID=1968433 RepID=A0A254T6S4_9BURK|nr:hypothetical protein AYR66_02555 [Noviherbaspirillum denitrificans]